jgi:hypothetical protein
MKRVRGIIKGKKKNPPHLHKKIGTIHNGILESFTLCKTKKNKKEFYCLQQPYICKKGFSKKKNQISATLVYKKALCANYSNTSW